MSKVYFIKHHLLQNLRKTLAENLKKKFKKGDVVVIKPHMGEYGNLAYVRPPIVGLVVEELKKIGVKPFISETLTLYSGGRDSVEKSYETARKNGFTEETMGCSIIISDESIKKKSKFFKNGIDIAKKPYDADGMVIISHFKGHDLATFGGAIKNIGMGFVPKSGKKTLHIDTQAEINQSKCIGCGICKDICFGKAISIKNKKAVINYDNCFGCCNCVDFCSQKAIKEKTTSLANGLGEVCSFFVDKFRNKSLYVNVMLDITSMCDCCPLGSTDMGKIVSPNVGIAVSDDIVAIDKASFDLVQKASNGRFAKIIKSNPLKQIDAGLKFELGSDNYEIVEIN
ncbi:MAG: DUF362 domain-containing protein [Nanoarchaeota archaeon]|nr:DUF362 domain-containing protein [Nanoarchaeota archaeon]